MAQCPQCGATAYGGASFCTACGATLGSSARLTFPGTAAPIAQMRPVGVTIIGIVFLVAAAGLALLALVVVFWIFLGAAVGSAFAEAIPWFGMFAGVGALVVFLAMIYAFVVAGLAALIIATGVGVLRGRSWAWTATLVFAGLNALGSLGNLASRDIEGLFGLAVSGVIFWYFFQTDVKRWFGKA